MPNRTYVLFQSRQRGKVVNFTGLAMSPTRFHHAYETERHPTDDTFIGTTKDMWEHRQEVERNLERMGRSTNYQASMAVKIDSRPLTEEEVRLSYGNSLARISDTLLRVTPEEGLKVGPTSEPKR